MVVKLPSLKPKKYTLPVNYVKTSRTERRLVREQYVEEQKGRCCHCGELLTDESGEINKEIPDHQFPRGFYAHPIHLHHNHDNDMTIGAVHAHCNAVLWHWYGE